VKPDIRWSAFWAALALIAIGGEAVALIINGATDSFSAQVWWVVGLSPWLRWVGVLVFGAGGAWMAAHFFGDRT